MWIFKILRNLSFQFYTSLLYYSIAKSKTLGVKVKHVECFKLAIAFPLCSGHNYLNRHFPAVNHMFKVNNKNTRTKV